MVGRDAKVGHVDSLFTKAFGLKARVGRIYVGKNYFQGSCIFMNILILAQNFVLIHYLVKSQPCVQCLSGF